MIIKYIKCKTGLSYSKLPGLDYSLNPYVGCQHKCAYCYAPNVLKIDREEWCSNIGVKYNIPIILSNELKKKKNGTIGISTVTDPYQPIDKKYKLTRYCLEQLLIHDMPICVQTKSSLIVRDIDLISKFSDAEVMVSIGTINDSERKMLEPGSSSINDRLDALKEYSDIGVKTSIFFGPIYPTIKTEDIADIIDTFAETGAKEIMVDKFNLKPGVGQALEEKMPGCMNNINNKDNFNEIYYKIIQLSENKNIEISLAF